MPGRLRTCNSVRPRSSRPVANEFVDQAPTVGEPAVDRLDRHGERGGPLGTDASRHADGSAGAWDEAQRDLRQGDARVRISDDSGREGRDLDPTAEGDTVEVGNHATCEQMHQLAGVLGEADAMCLSAIRSSAELGQVTTAAERHACTGELDDPYGVVGEREPESVAQLVSHLAGDGVVAVGAIERHVQLIASTFERDRRTIPSIELGQSSGPPGRVLAATLQHRVHGGFGCKTGRDRLSRSLSQQQRQSDCGVRVRDRHLDDAIQLGLGDDEIGLGRARAAEAVADPTHDDWQACRVFDVRDGLAVHDEHGDVVAEEVRPCVGVGDEIAVAPWVQVQRADAPTVRTRIRSR